MIKLWMVMSMVWAMVRVYIMGLGDDSNQWQSVRIAANLTLHIDICVLASSSRDI